MKLLVSAADVADAIAAMEGGADFVDAKDPEMGPLGHVSLDLFRRMHAAIAGRKPVTAAIGDARDEAGIARLAFEFCEAGAEIVKVGFAGIGAPARVAALMAAAARGAASSSRRTAGIIAVAYADADRVAAPRPDVVLAVAVRLGVRGVLLDTADKHGPGLRQLLPDVAMAAWVRSVRDGGMLAAVAGKLGRDDLTFVSDCGADVAGVRGAACGHGRSSSVNARLVTTLRERCRPHQPEHTSA